ncbi:DUF7544 domain-containing protein [Halorubrum tropicale]|uniref:Uncharacterized protein n=1 Tax=Halorubrum tropicale TaxID=1765655 RepID=A0A0N0UAI9_9EURY|nr:hypothetical protein [Halorubrum tropicale]KOX95514.1 hypothetical protein AMR74_13445 [Halorubrum tropicale]
MSRHAVEAVDRAVRVTRGFLFPFEAVRWAKLGFLALVMVSGGAGASGATTSSLGGPAGGGAGDWSDAGVTEPVSVPAGVERAANAGVERLAGFDTALLAGLDAALLTGLALGVLLAGMALFACSIAFRLVFYEALSTTEVALWRPFRDRFRQALGLLGVAVLSAVAVGLPAVAVAIAIDPDLLRFLGVSAGGLAARSSVIGPAFGVLAVIGATVAVVGTVVSRITFEFVAPAMVARDVGVIDGWRAVWASFRGSWADVVFYFAVHLVLAAGVGIVQAVAAAFVAGVVGVSALVALLLAAVALGGVGALIGTTAGAIALAAVLVCAVVAVVVLTLPATLVVRTYLTAFEVSTLAGIDPTLAPLAPTLAASDDREPTGE